MKHTLWRGILVLLLLSSVCAVRALGPNDLAVDAWLDDDAAYPGGEVVVEGIVKDYKDLVVPGAAVNVSVEKTNISVSTSTDDRGIFIASFTAPLATGNYSINVSAVLDALSGFSILFLEVVSPPPPAPDIRVSSEDIAFWSDAFVTDSKVWVNATVRNAGDLGANATVKIFLGTPFEGELLFSERVSIPAAGFNVSSVMWPALSGAHLFTVVADQVDPSDGNPTNNQANNTLYVEDIMPPVISDMSVSPEEPTSLDTISVLVPVEDDLGLAKSDPVILVFSIGDAEEEVLPMNETKDGFLAEAGPFPGGSFVLFKVRASDLSNNIAETDWQRVDILYSGIKVAVGNATSKPGKELFIGCSAMFEDGSPVFGQEASLALDGVEYTSITDSAGRAIFNITAPSEPGEYAFTVSVTEKRLSANSSAVLTVVPVYPDIMIIQNGIVFSWANVSEVEVTVVLFNKGEAPGVVHLQVFQGTPFSGMLLNASDFAISPGEFHYHTFSWSPEPGHHALVAVANCSDDLEPWDNMAAAEVTIPEQDGAVDDDNDNGQGNDDDSEEGEDAGIVWSFDLIVLLVGLGSLLSLLAILIITKYMARRKGE